MSGLSSKTRHHLGASQFYIMIHQITTQSQQAEKPENSTTETRPLTLAIWRAFITLTSSKHDHKSMCASQAMPSGTTFVNRHNLHNN